MNRGRTIFAQLMDLLPLAEFRRCVDRYRGDYKVQSFSCLDQYLCLAFAQLTYREILRDIETCLRAHSSQLYHPGFRGGISPNAVKAQVWVAITVYVLVAVLKKQLRLDLSLCKILPILSVTIFEKTPILEGFFNSADGIENPNLGKQLNLFEF
jgi:Domain of unknown function (DUF4372)